MDSIQAIVEHFARHRIEQAGGDTDPVLVVIRGDRIVSVLESADTGEHLGLARLTAAGYGADALAVALEGVVPLTETYPLSANTQITTDRDHINAIRTHYARHRRG